MSSNVDVLGRRDIGVVALQELFDPDDYFTTEGVRERTEQVLGRPVSHAAVRRWETEGTVAGGVLPSRKILNRRLVKKTDLESFLRRVLGEEGAS